MIRPLARGRPSPALARLLLAAMVALIVCAAAAVHLSGALRPLDDGLAQLRFQLLQRPASRTLTVVEIDPGSLKAAGAWPWSRERYARVTDNLMAAGAELVAFDVDFSARSSPDADADFAATIRRHPGAVVLPTFVQAAGGGEPRLVGSSPLSAFAGDAVLASVNVPVDSDGRVRRYRTGYGAGEGERASMASVLAGAPPGRTGAFLIDYGVRLDDIDRLSFEDVYRGRFDPADVRGRKILIGATALELGDEFATPRRGTLPGVYIHALAYESLRAGRALGRAPTPLLLLFAAGAVWLLRPRGALDLAGALRRHAFVAAGAVLVPIGVQAVAPISIDTGVLIVAQVLCLIWTVRAELRRRAKAVTETREAHLIQVAALMRQSRNRIRAANRKLKETNAALDKALKARTEFLATTSHEIRTPLNGIMGMTQVILADRNLPPALREKIDLVHGAGETMLALIEDILDVAKIENGHLVIAPADMDLGKLLREAGQLWTDRAAEKGLALHVDDQAPAWIHEDAVRMRQIVFNLMSNAIKFTDAGDVTLRARTQTAPDGAEVLTIEVADSGIGVPADMLDAIFESFRQVDGGASRRHGGAGLGLAISRRLATAMGGELTVRSAPGEGSVFTLRLPLRRVSGAVSASGGLSGAAVLLVEANPLARGVLKAALADEAPDLAVAGSVEEACEILSARRFALVLADGNTVAGPLGDDGLISGLGRIAAAAAGAPLCVLWAGPDGDAARLHAAGAHHVARKPIVAAALVEDLRALCASRVPVEAERPAVAR